MDKAMDIPKHSHRVIKNFSDKNYKEFCKMLWPTEILRLIMLYLYQSKIARSDGNNWDQPKCKEELWPYIQNGWEKEKKSTLISNGKSTHKNMCFLKENGGHTQY